MEATLREMRIGDLRAKISACQEECSELAKKASAPFLTVEEKTTIDRLRDQTITHCHNLRHLLGLYDLEGESCQS